MTTKFLRRQDGSRVPINAAILSVFELDESTPIPLSLHLILLLIFRPTMHIWKINDQVHLSGNFEIYKYTGLSAKYMVNMVTKKISQFCL
jgi:hypothetical protein